MQIILPIKQRTDFYRPEVYSLWNSMHVLIPSLQKEDLSAMNTVKAALKCFEPYSKEGPYYARAVSYTHSE